MKIKLLTLPVLLQPAKEPTGGQFIVNIFIYFNQEIN